jgi:hypothetical protein
MAILDHIGLNRYVYMTASADTMTLGSHTVSDISNSSGNSILGSSLDDSRLLLGINLYNNGPYGHSSWQQIRVSENPLSRHMRANNQFSIVRPGKERISFVNGKRTVVPERHGTTELLDEPAIVSAYKPFFIVGTVDGYDALGRPKEETFRKRSSLNNNTAYFTNDLINDIANVKEKTDQAYDSLKGYYLENALEDETSPLNSFEKLVFRQNIYPPQKYTYKSYTRARTNFTFSWREALANRQQTTASYFRYTYGSIASSSIWPLDVDPNWQNFETPLINNLGISTASSPSTATITSSFGILWNHYSQVANNLTVTSSLSAPYDKNKDSSSKLRPGPIYARRHTLIPSESVTAPSGLLTLQGSDDMTSATIFGGEAAWDVPTQSGKFPFYDSYEDCSENIRGIGKSYTIIPEYKMSDHVQQLLESGSLADTDTMFSIEGGQSGNSDSSSKEFYEIYSNSDFLKNFDIVLDDHKEFTEPSEIRIRCKVIKKLVPYDGFYPVQRTTDLAKQFFNSYNSFTKVSASNTSGFNVVATFPHAFQNILTPLFAPGVLYNAIKSGVACDYPIITASLAHAGAYSGDYTITKDNFDKRIPFEALVEPEKHLSNYVFVNNEPHPSGNLSSSVIWDGNGDGLYKMMANNFTAEVPRFFLKDESFTTISSLPQGDPNFGQAESGSAYSMRVKMYRSMNEPNLFIDNDNNINYQPPQDICTGQKETMTMYSRVSAFGPPCFGRFTKTGGSAYNNSDTSGVTVSSNDLLISSREGFNYPFTPPYYHGQAWADITFIATADKKYTIDEIINSSSVAYTRFDSTTYLHAAVAGTVLPNLAGPQRADLLNGNALQLSASLNIFGKGKLPSALSSFGIEVQVDDQTKTRWIIQPKFETPILNFQHQKDNRTLPNNASSASVPLGMWHQYGRLPAENEGIYMQVTDIPSSWQIGNLGKSVSQAATTGSLAELCGFTSEPIKLGKTSTRKRISECVVAVPFIEDKGVKSFFRINEKMVKRAIDGETEAIDETVIDMIDKMRRFIFPPTMDFVNFPKKVEPIAMYVFEFSSNLSTTDLTDIWQNVLPSVGISHEEQEVAISHSLINDKRRLLSKKKLRSDIRWMVFKVKQRAASRYFEQVYTRKGDQTTSMLGEGIEADSIGPRSKIQYNWPYDFFSLVELVKIDASIKLSDVEEDDQGETVDKPKRATEASRNVDFTNLFPKSK